MNASLESEDSGFTGLRLSHIRTLIGLVTQRALCDTANVRRRFNEQATDFDATLTFLIELGIIKLNDEVLSTTSVFDSGPEVSRIEELLLTRITKSNGRYRENLFAFLRRFQILSGNVCHKPTPDERSGESATRNFLMELSLLSFDSIENQYTLAAEGYPLFIHSLQRPAATPAEIQAKNDSNLSVGSAAESAVIEFERVRLGPHFADRVEHVAISNASAGFDIGSVTIDESSELIPRLIEVKAVSPTDFGFYWSKNEIEASRNFGPWYYLYLVPIDSRQRCRMDLLEVICDPHNTILPHPEHWNIESTVLRCTPARNVATIHQ